MGKRTETEPASVERTEEVVERTRNDPLTSSEPSPVTLRLLESEEGLEVVLEGEVKSLGREVSDDVGGVSSPESSDSLIGVGPPEAVSNTGVRSSKSSLLDPVGEEEEK